MYLSNWAAVVPMANESEEFAGFITEMTRTLDRLGTGKVYLVVDNVSKDDTWKMCREHADEDPRYQAIWAPENRNVVDAYLRGFKEALKYGHEIIIEMDAGLSHDPRAIPMFLRVLSEGNDCAFGSRFINGGSMTDAPLSRRALSRGGTLLSNILLGTTMYDMTSGFQGFHAHILQKLVAHPLLSTAHFYQTEVRYLLRKQRFAEIPIHYKAPSPRVSRNAVRNAMKVLCHYFIKKMSFRAASI